jgi:thiol-disulfide isomerase/thioredoxin
MMVKRYSMTLNVAAIGFVLILALLSQVSLAKSDNDPPVFRTYDSQFTRIRPLRQAPLTPILTADGGVLNLSRFQGKVVLLNFWATWCPPCIREMPSLDRLQAELGGDTFTVVVLSIDRLGLDVVTPFFKRLGVKNLTIYLDPKSTAGNAFGLYGLPISYIIDHEGLVMGYLVGAAEWDSVEARSLLNYYIGRIGD